ncbi:MAG: hypothetical protein ACYTDY_00685 [Planctomycetota bacterium]
MRPHLVEVLHGPVELRGGHVAAAGFPERLPELFEVLEGGVRQHLEERVLRDQREERTDVEHPLGDLRQTGLRLGRLERLGGRGLRLHLGEVVAAG